MNIQVRKVFYGGGRLGKNVGHHVIPIVKNFKITLAKMFQNSPKKHPEIWARK